MEGRKRVTAMGALDHGTGGPKTTNTINSKLENWRKDGGGGEGRIDERREETQSTLKSKKTETIPFER